MSDVEGAAPTSPGYILLIEDDPALARSIGRNLSIRGHAVKSVNTIAGALQSLKEECAAVVLLDIDLPDGSGWEVLRWLRAGACKDAAVIVMSALRPNARLASDYKCVAVMEKPFPIESLLRLVSESLRRVEGQAPRQMSS